MHETETIKILLKLIWIVLKTIITIINLVRIIEYQDEFPIKLIAMRNCKMVNSLNRRHRLGSNGVLCYLNVRFITLKLSHY